MRLGELTQKAAKAAGDPSSMWKSDLCSRSLHQWTAKYWTFKMKGRLWDFLLLLLCLFCFILGGGGCCCCCLAGKSCIAWFRLLFLFTSANALLLVLRVLDKVPELSEGTAELFCLFCCQPVCLFSKYIGPGFSSVQLGVWLIYNRRAQAGAAWNAPSCSHALQQSLMAGQESFLSSFISLLKKKKITKG